VQFEERIRSEVACLGEDKCQPAPTLSRVIGAYKSLTTVAWIRACKTIGIQGVGTFWLDDFYDRIIPNTTALQRIRHYIRQNPTALATREG
jgi:hypothetical protein